MKNVILALIVSASGVAMAQNGPLAGDKQGVDNACTAEASTAGCGTEKVGTGLLKCIHGYKKQHKDFTISDGCKAAMKKLHQDKKAMKESQ